MLAYGAVMAVAAATTYVLTFAVRRLAVRIGAVALPDQHRVHERATPILGGAAMFGAFLVAFGVASLLPKFRPAFESSSEPFGVVLGAALMFGVGLIDDLQEVSAPAKLAGQVLAASALYFLGVTMFYFRIPFAGFVALSPDLIPLVTVLWVCGMANAVNLIDGLDGLAAGIVAIASLAFFLYGYRLSYVGLLGQDNIGPLVAAIAFGVCLGFLPHNFYPARVFMGDSGALLLGLLMASSTMVVGGRTADQFSGQTYFFFAPLFVPLLVMGVPIVDTATAIFRRARRGQGVAERDTEHLHYRLMRLGHGHRRSVVILWAWTAVLSGLVLFPTYTGRGNLIVVFGLAGLAVGLYTVFHPGVRGRNGLVLDAPEADPTEADAEVAIPPGDRLDGAGPQGVPTQDLHPRNSVS